MSLYEKLAELKRCFDDGLINDQQEYDLFRREVINFWITQPPAPKRSFWERFRDIARKAFLKVIDYITDGFNSFMRLISYK
ncbi:12887_t:CDS:2 [Funneliformis geosporum]|nr:12887_t:CDS:2 [Funneliformis geosporum]